MCPFELKMHRVLPHQTGVMFHLLDLERLEDTLFDAVHKFAPLLGRQNTANYNSPVVFLQQSPLQILISDVIYSENLYSKEAPGMFLAQNMAWHYFPLQSIGMESANDEVWPHFCSIMPPVMYHAVWIIIHHLKFLGEANGLAAKESVARCSWLLGFAHCLFQRDLPDQLNSGSCMQLVFLLEVVSWYSPCAQLRHVN